MTLFSILISIPHIKVKRTAGLQRSLSCRSFSLMFKIGGHILIVTLAVFEVVESDEEADVVLLTGWLRVENNWGEKYKIMAIIHTAAAKLIKSCLHESGRKPCLLSSLSDVGNLHMSLNHVHSDNSNVVEALGSGAAGVEESEGQGIVLEATGWNWSRL